MQPLYNWLLQRGVDVTSLNPRSVTFWKDYNDLLRRSSIMAAQGDDDNAGLDFSGVEFEAYEKDELYFKSIPELIEATIARQQRLTDMLFNQEIDGVIYGKWLAAIDNAHRNYAMKIEQGYGKTWL